MCPWAGGEVGVDLSQVDFVGTLEPRVGYDFCVL